MKKIALALALGLSINSAPALAAKRPQLTPMELQAIQSKEFETTKDAAFGALMTVIQDLGYTVQSADVNTGFITAASPTENKTGFFDAMAGAAASGNTVMTAFLMQMPSGMTRVRLNFVNSKNLSSGYGQQSRQDKPILDAKVYQTAWEKIDEALFVMGALASSAPKAAPSPSPVINSAMPAVSATTPANLAPTNPPGPNSAAIVPANQTATPATRQR